MNIIDVAMLLGLIVGVAIGFVRGLFQQALGLLSIYISLVVSVWAYRVFGSAFKALFPSLTRASADILGFITVLIFVLNVLAFLARDIEKNAHWVERIPALVNQTGGLALGFVTTAFWLGLAGTAFIIVSRAPWIGAEEAHQTFVELVDNSIMIYVFRYACIIRHLSLGTRQVARDLCHAVLIPIWFSQGRQTKALTILFLIAFSHGHDR
jgi:uncharacterized membrane protein required for colicin V production